ncbi:hypothetical protein EDD53_2051 [Pacificibacter maritimus]|uniref:Uncharacterized protein n=1 Tax=Pacificibacter maritimus TaxID=762213 RepID=A0A3N4UGR1_9RHOB|nr:hypothetical protein EDD53_2051 [Pacificibacter maritimus]
MNESAARGSLFFKEKYARTRGAFKERIHLRPAQPRKTLPWQPIFQRKMGESGGGFGNWGGF